MKSKERVAELLEEGTATDAQIANEAGFSPRSVKRFKAKFRKGGRDALLKGAPRGRPPRLKLDARRLTPVLSVLFRNRRGSWKSATRLVNRIHGVEYSPEHVRRLLHDQWTPRRSHLLFAQELLARSDFKRAEDELLKIYDRNGNYEVEAEAAARLLWNYYERGEYEPALSYFTASMSDIESLTGYSHEEIIESIGSGSALMRKGARGAKAMSLALHFRCKVLLEKAIYHGRTGLFSETETAIQQSLKLDKHLGLEGSIGHDTRLMAMLRAAQGDYRGAEKLFAESAEMFGFNPFSLGAVYLARDRGFLLLQKGQFGKAAASLLDAAGPLAGELRDARALGPAYRILSKVEFARHRRKEALDYALAGAVLHPYGFVLNGLANSIKENNAHRELARAIRAFRDGKRGPFVSARELMERLAGGNRAGERRINENLARIERLIGN